VPARRAALATLALVSGGCLLQDNPAYDERCGDGRFAFGVISDAGASGSLPRALGEIAAKSDVHAVFGAGDLTPMVDVRAAIDMTAAPTGECAPEAIAWFPALGAEEREMPADIDAWSNTWAARWADDPSASPLATQLPGMRAFAAGPSMHSGTVYAFEYGGAHFSVLDTYERGVGTQPGIAFESEQLGWLRDELAATDVDARFVIGHVPLEPACYDATELCNHPPPGCEYEIPWTAAEDMPDTKSLSQTFAELGVDAYLHGRDNMPGRRLLDGSGSTVYDRLIFDVFDACTMTLDPIGDPAEWEAAQSQPGRFWQVDAGAIADMLGSYAIVTVTDAEIQFELFAFLEGSTTQLFDSWTVPR
jgi:hypothetical protein